MSIELMMPSSHFILCHLLLLLQSFPASVCFPMSQFFKSDGQSIGASAFSISPSIDYSGLISFRMDWFDLLAAVQGTPPRVFSNTSVLKHQLFGAQVSLWSNSHIHTYMTTGKTIALTRWTFVGKVMSLLFNRLSRFVIAFLPRSKRLLISWLQSPHTVILEHKKIKSVTVSTFPSSVWHEVMGS